MRKTKKLVIGTAACVTAAAIAVGGVWIWRNGSGSDSTDGVAYVCTVSDVNTALTVNTDLRFSGVVEPQETKEIKADLTKTISDIAVQEGDHVEAGAALFTYDVESMELELQQGQVEVERMENEIAASQQQITQLETEKKSANSDDQLTYTTQIQSLETDIAKAEYDIKAKNIELEKLQNTIDNATVTAEIAGTVQSLKTVEQLQSDGTDVLLKITSDGEFRVKCTASEQNMYQISNGEAVVIQSRVDDSTWSGTISEIGTEPETSQSSYYYYSDDSTTASKYPFYITLDSSEGLMLGQHLLVIPSDGDAESKSGIWLYEGYVVTEDDGTSYVWATDSKDKLEKRIVEVGQYDETLGEYEILSGLDGDDWIAYPSGSYVEGMRTTTNPDEATDEEVYDEYEYEDYEWDEEEVYDEDTVYDEEEGGEADGT